MAAPRWMTRALLVGAALMAFAVGYNHHDKPCDIGAAGMCITAQAGGAR
ncbi:hypothetical protein ABZU92_18230 [Micromonospora arida]